MSERDSVEQQGSTQKEKIFGKQFIPNPHCYEASLENPDILGVGLYILQQMHAQQPTLFRPPPEANPYARVGKGKGKRKKGEQAPSSMLRPSGLLEVPLSVYKTLKAWEGSGIHLEYPHAQLVPCLVNPAKAPKEADRSIDVYLLAIQYDILPVRANVLFAWSSDPQSTGGGIHDMKSFSHHP